jgi:Ricin-type beta-trefoil lectin domain-like
VPVPNWCTIYVGFCLCIAFPPPASSQTTPIYATASGVAGVFCDPHGDYFYDDTTRTPSNPTDVADGETYASAACPSHGLTGSGHARSTASLRGTLLAHADANSSGPTDEPPINVDIAGAGAHAEFANSVIHNPPPNNPSQENEYIIGMRVDGRLEQGSGEGGGASGNVCINVNNSGNSCTLFGHGGASGSTPLPFIFTKKLVLLGPTFMMVVVSLDADASTGGGNKDGGSSSPSADFGESARTFVQLPPGWTFTSGSGDFLSYQIRVLQSGRCLDADTGSIGGNGTKVQLWDCWGGKNQSWAVNSDGTIVNLQSGRCLDADTGTIGNNGTNVQLWDCGGAQNQVWVH